MTMPTKDRLAAQLRKARTDALREAYDIVIDERQQRRADASTNGLWTASERILVLMDLPAIFDCLDIVTMIDDARSRARRTGAGGKKHRLAADRGLPD